MGLCLVESAQSLPESSAHPVFASEEEEGEGGRDEWICLMALDVSFANYVHLLHVQEDVLYPANLRLLKNPSRFCPNTHPSIQKVLKNWRYETACGVVWIHSSSSLGPVLVVCVFNCLWGLLVWGVPAPEKGPAFSKPPLWTLWGEDCPPSATEGQVANQRGAALLALEGKLVSPHSPPTPPFIRVTCRTYLPHPITHEIYQCHSLNGTKDII